MRNRERGIEIGRESEIKKKKEIKRGGKRVGIGEQNGKYREAEGVRKIENESVRRRENLCALGLLVLSHMACENTADCQV